MERSDERLSTRDIASPATTDDPRFDRDDTAADTQAAEPARDTMADPTIGSGGANADPAATAEPIAADEPVAADEPIRTDEPVAVDEPADDPVAAESTRTTERTTAEADAGPLLPDSEGFQSRWEDIQVRFVDEPRGAVEDADALVATVMQKLAEGFAQERERLEAQWGRGEDISTEDLRVALQRYRSFFQRLLST